MDTLRDIKELSYDQLRQSIAAALNPPQSFPVCRPGGYTWIRELYSDRVIVETGEPNSDLHEIAYTVAADGTVTFGQPVEVEITYTPVPTAGKEMAIIHEVPALPSRAVGEPGRYTMPGIDDLMVPVEELAIAEGGAKAVWTVAYINDLPDSAFLLVEPGDKDETGKTTPRSLRHFPYKDAAGKVDLPHLRNAIPRIPQSNAPGLDDAKKTALQDRARKILDQEQGGSKAQAQKAGKRMMQRMADDFKAALDTLGKVLNWATYADGEATPDEVVAATDPAGAMAQKERGFKVYRDTAGKARWLAWTTNAFEDREGEIFQTKALEDEVLRTEKEWPDDDRGLLLWHVKGSQFGTTDWRGVVGRILVESGTFDDTSRGQKAAAYLRANPDQFTHMSHGYQYRRDDKAGRVYEWLHIKERSVLPATAAANPWTQFGVKEPDMMLTKDKRSALEQVFGADEAAAIITAAEQKSKELEQDIAYKATVVGEPPPAETVAPDSAEAVKAMAEAMAQSPAMVALAASQKEAAEGVKAVQAALVQADAAVKALGDRLTTVEKAQRDGNLSALADLPRRSFYQASKAADTVVDPRTEAGQKLAADAPQGVKNPGHPLNNPIK